MVLTIKLFVRDAMGWEALLSFAFWAPFSSQDIQCIDGCHSMGARDKGCEACLDDFILLGSPGTNHCARDVERHFITLGVPVAENKLVGPSTCLMVQGIEIDLVQMKLRLPEDKLERVKGCVGWGRRSYRNFHWLFTKCFF